MLHLLFGDNEYLIEETLATLKEAVGPAELRDVNITELEGRNASLEQVQAMCSTVPFLADKRLVIVRGLLTRAEPRRGGASHGERGSAVRSEWAGLVEYVEQMPETTDLALVDGRLSQNNSLLRLFGPVGNTKAFPLPAGNDLKLWIRKRAEAKGMGIEPRAVEALAETIGGDLRAIDSELDKLSLYTSATPTDAIGTGDGLPSMEPEVSGGNRPVTEEDVRSLVAYAREASIFVAVDAVVEGRPDVALRTIHRLLDTGSSPAYLLVMLARQVRFLIVAHDLKGRGHPDSEIGKRLRLSGHPLRKTMNQVTMFTAQALAEVHRKLLETDLSIKTGELEEQVAVELLIAELASTAFRAGRR